MSIWWKPKHALLKHRPVLFRLLPIHDHCCGSLMSWDNSIPLLLLTHLPEKIRVGSLHMKRRWRKQVQEWREIAERCFARDPDSQVGQSLLKCANDVEVALNSKRGRAVIVAIVLAATALLADARELLADRQEDHSLMTTYTLAAPRPVPFEIPAIPLEHNPEERSGDNVVITSSQISASGSNQSGSAAPFALDADDWGALPIRTTYDSYANLSAVLQIFQDDAIVVPHEQGNAKIESQGS